ncbi:MAG: hypothetical protein ACLP00_19435 [Terracidiphilus sp.]
MVWMTFREIKQCDANSHIKLALMAASLYIVVEGEDPGFDTFVNGRSLARNEEALDRLAATLRVRSLLEFFSADKNSMALLLEQGIGEPEWAQNLPQPQWYSPADGLVTIRTLIDFLAGSPSVIGSETLPILSELREYERVLNKTADHGLRWHLAASWR